MATTPPMKASAGLLADAAPVKTAGATVLVNDAGATHVPLDVAVDTASAGDEATGVEATGVDTTGLVAGAPGGAGMNDVMMYVGLGDEVEDVDQTLVLVQTDELVTVTGVVYHVDAEYEDAYTTE